MKLKILAAFAAAIVFALCAGTATAEDNPQGQIQLSRRGVWTVNAFANMPDYKEYRYNNCEVDLARFTGTDKSTFRILTISNIEEGQRGDGIRQTIHIHQTDESAGNWSVYWDLVHYSETYKEWVSVKSIGPVYDNFSDSGNFPPPEQNRINETVYTGCWEPIKQLPLEIRKLIYGFYHLLPDGSPEDPQ